MFKKEIILLLAATMLVTQPIYIHAKTDSPKTISSKTSITQSKLFPTEDYNIVMKLNLKDATEEYTYYNRRTGEAEKYTVSDGEIVSKEVTKETLHPYDLLFKEDSRVVYPDIKNVYFSYVTLPNTVDYIYQMDTGKYSSNNCVPTSIAMVYNWANGLTKKNGVTAQWVRDSYPSDTKDIDDPNYTLGYTYIHKEQIFKELGLDFTTSGYYTSPKVFISELNEGKIINLSANSAYFTYNPDKTSRIDKSYSGGGGHSILCTGYLYVIIEDPKTGKVTEETYYEIADPAEGGFNNVRYYRQASIENMLMLENCTYIAINYTGGK